MSTAEQSRWLQIEELFHLCLDLHVDARREILQQRQGDDPELVAEVQALLDSSSSPSVWIEDAFRDALEETEALDQPRLYPGARIGPYRILRELGEGGLGIVFLAERADDHYAMQVAVKVVKRGMDTREILRRSRLERQILANLDHPNIARLLDGGATDDGLPYFVMELIGGQPIDEYCREQKLALIDRLRLFQRVCEAVHYAHQNLVVHRDIKPGNILVTSDGVPKLLDFGIAKLLHPDGDPRAQAFTSPGVRLLTPDYASPEQILGQPLSTATDVYSLGVLLFRLLCDEHPYALTSRQPQELERVICEGEVGRPSSVVARCDLTSVADMSPHKLSVLIQGDLDNIVAKALRKEPVRRYGSAEQMSQDIDRFLCDQPVLARPDTLPYRTSKFMRRNRIPVAVVTMIFTILVVAVIVNTRAAQRALLAQEEAEAHLELAQAERVRAEQASDLMLEILEVLELGEALKSSVKVRDIDRLVDRVLENKDQPPLIRAANLDTTGRLYRQLGWFEKVEPRLVAALAIREKEPAVDPLDLATSKNRLGELYYIQGRIDEATRLILDSLATRRLVLGNEDPQVAESLNNLGAIHRRLGDSEKAEAMHREALRIRRLVPGIDPLDVANSLTNLAVVLYGQGELEESAGYLKEALLIQQGELGEEHPSIAREMVRLAAVLFGLGEHSEADHLFGAGLAIQRRYLEPKHPHLAFTLNNYAELREVQERYSEAEAMFRESLELQRQGADATRTVSSMNNLANLLVKAGGDRAEARALYQDGLQIRQRHLPQNHDGIAVSSFFLGRFLVDENELHLAESHLMNALSIRLQNHPEEHWRVAEVQSVLGACWAGLGRVSEAEELLRKSSERLLAKLGFDDPRTQRANSELAKVVGD